MSEENGCSFLHVFSIPYPGTGAHLFLESVFTVGRIEALGPTLSEQKLNNLLCKLIIDFKE